MRPTFVGDGCHCPGHLYHAEEYLPREIDKALAWLHRSADAGNADANYYLAMMHITSDGIQGQDKVRSIDRSIDR